ncbi:MAG: hypothetical protein PXX73_00085 [Sideroxydans sp.]|nr:hypothetical protein [Sideroxydans sp.]
MNTLIASLKRRLLLLVFLLLGVGGAMLAATWMLVCIVFAPHGTRPWHIAIAFDQLANATTGGNEDETISSRAGRLQREGRGWACVLCRLLDWLQKDYCKHSIGV